MTRACDRLTEPTHRWNARWYARWNGPLTGLLVLLPFHAGLAAPPDAVPSPAAGTLPAVIYPVRDSDTTRRDPIAGRTEGRDNPAETRNSTVGSQASHDAELRWNLDRFVYAVPGGGVRTTDDRPPRIIANRLGDHARPDLSPRTEAAGTPALPYPDRLSVTRTVIGLPNALPGLIVPAPAMPRDRLPR